MILRSVPGCILQKLASETHRSEVSQRKIPFSRREYHGSAEDLLFEIIDPDPSLQGWAPAPVVLRNAWVARRSANLQQATWLVVDGKTKHRGKAPTLELLVDRTFDRCCFFGTSYWGRRQRRRICYAAARNPRPIILVPRNEDVTVLTMTIDTTWVRQLSSIWA